MNANRLLVTLQLLLITALLIHGGGELIRDWRLMAGCFLAMLLLLHAALAMRLHNIRISPEPHAGAELCTRGAYRWIRHPMYASVLAVALCLAIGAGTILGWLLWLALAGVLWVKLLREERLWQSRTPAYADYMRKTKRLIPYVL